MSFIIGHRKIIFHNFVIDNIYNQLEDVFFFWNERVNLESYFKYWIIDDKGKFWSLETFIGLKEINKLFWEYNKKRYPDKKRFWS